MDNSSSSRFELKVGLFIATGIIFIAILMLNFSKGVTFFQPTYQVHVIMPTLSGLKPKSSVMVAGVPVGTVASTDLSPNGTNVTITLRILSKYKIHADAKFHVDTLGFLGDQYIAVTPTHNEAPVLKNGDVVIGQAPFDIQEAVRSTAGLLEQARQTMQNLDQTITNINRSVLSEQTLTNFGNSVSNLHSVTVNALAMSQAAQDMLASNTVPISSTVSNLNVVSQKLNTMADDLSQTISTNREGVTDAVRDFRETARNFSEISRDLRAGKGLAGSVLKDEHLNAQVTTLIANANALVYNLGEFSKSLNEKGLWTMLWKPKHPTDGVPVQPPK